MVFVGRRGGCFQAPVGKGAGREGLCGARGGWQQQTTGLARLRVWGEEAKAGEETRQLGARGLALRLHPWVPCRFLGNLHPEPEGLDDSIQHVLSDHYWPNKRGLTARSHFRCTKPANP